MHQLLQRSSEGRSGRARPANHMQDMHKTSHDPCACMSVYVLPPTRLVTLPQSLWQKNKRTAYCKHLRPGILWPLLNGKVTAKPVNGHKLDPWSVCFHNKWQLCFPTFHKDFWLIKTSSMQSSGNIVLCTVNVTPSAPLSPHSLPGSLWAIDPMWMQASH